MSETSPSCPGCSHDSSALPAVDWFGVALGVGVERLSGNDTDSRLERNELFLGEGGAGLGVGGGSVPGLGVMTRNLFLGKKRTPLPDPGVFEARRIPRTPFSSTPRGIKGDGLRKDGTSRCAAGVVERSYSGSVSEVSGEMDWADVSSSVILSAVGV